jgi:hypothetical protein
VSSGPWLVRRGARERTGLPRHGEHVEGGLPEYSKSAKLAGDPLVASMLLRIDCASPSGWDVGDVPATVEMRAGRAGPVN